MSGLGTSTQQTQQQSQSSPWAPTQPLLQNILGNLGNVNQGVTPGQSSAVGGLQTAANSLQNFGPQVAGTAAAYLDPLNSQNRAILGGVNQAGNTLAPYMNPNYLNPFTNPNLSAALKYMNQDISNDINGEFAAAGRDLSPANTKALGYGLGQADTNAAFGQYNNNVQAQQNATNQWLQSLLSGNQALQGNAQFGINAANLAPGAQLAPAQAQLGAANAGYNLPLANIGGVEGLTLPIAGLGGQTQSSGTVTNNASPLSQLMGVGSLFAAPGVSPISGIQAFGSNVLGGLGNIFAPNMNWGG